MPSAVTRFAYDKPELSLSVNPSRERPSRPDRGRALRDRPRNAARLDTDSLAERLATKLSDGRSIFVSSSCKGPERTDAIVASPPGGLPLPGLPRTRTPSASSLVVSVFAASRSGSAPALWSNTSAVGRFT
jgi:hypothetical protein